MVPSLGINVVLGYLLVFIIASTSVSDHFDIFPSIFEREHFLLWALV